MKEINYKITNTHVIRYKVYTFTLLPFGSLSFKKRTGIMKLSKFDEIMKRFDNRYQVNNFGPASKCIQS